MFWVGYYLQSCPKLLYKGDYHPSYLLDPETYEWNALDKDLRKLMDESKYICPSARAREQSGEKRLMSDTKKDTAKDVDVVNPSTEKEDENEEGKDAEDDDVDEDYDQGLLFGMPGTLTDQQLEEFDIGSIKIKVVEVQAHAKVIVCSWLCRMLVNKGTQQDLVGFEKRGGLRTILRETVATVGTEFARDMVLVLR